MVFHAHPHHFLLSRDVPITKKQPIRSTDPIIVFFSQSIRSTEPINRSDQPIRSTDPINRSTNHKIVKKKKVLRFIPNEKVIQWLVLFYHLVQLEYFLPFFNFITIACTCQQGILKMVHIIYTVINHLL